MFNLPALTVAVLFGMPALWVLYTVGFLYVSRHWHNDERQVQDDT